MAYPHHVDDDTGYTYFFPRHHEYAKAHQKCYCGMKSSYRGLGSIDIPASARSVLLVGRIKDNPMIRVMAQVKSSLAPEGEPIAFELNKETGFRFIGKYDISVDDLLNGTSSVSKVEQAESLLRDELASGNAIPQKQLKQKAQLRNISERTLNEAKKNLGIKSVKRNEMWFWQLSKEGCNIVCD